MIRYQIVVPGTPVAKGRPKFSNRGGFTKTYTPKKTADFEQLVHFTAIQAGVTPIPGPLRVTIRAYWPSVKPDRKKNPRPTCRRIKRPDADNVAKSVLDGLEGVAYSDDAAVCALHVFKWQAAQCDEPRTEIDIESIEGEQ